MKKNLLIITILIALLSVSCENFLDVNTDPNNPTEVSPDLVLPVGQVYTAKLHQQDRGINHLGNMFMYNWSESYGFSWYDEEFKYLVTSTFYDQIFDNTYSSVLKQYQVLTSLGEEYAHYVAIGNIMKAYHFQMMVDIYGDVPYSEALLRGENPTPTYDNEAVIYDNLLVKLTEAIATMKAADESEITVAPGDDNVMFGGNSAQWIQFANSLKLRILTRLNGVKDAQFITDELAVIASEGSGYITEDVGINPGYAVEEGKQNQFWEELGWTVTGTVTLSNDATCATQYILDYLTATADPRIDYLYELPASGHLGVEQGLEVDDAFAADFVSNIGPGILKSATMDAVIYTLAECYFNQAELALAGFGGDPAVLYDLGVQASFDYLGAGDATNYLSLSGQNQNYASSANKLEAIITQKWIATNGITAEQAWFDYSRTGFPSNLPVSNAASTPDRPVRLFYPDSEITGNGENVPDQPNAFNSKIFWAN